MINPLNIDFRAELSGQVYGNTQDRLTSELEKSVDVGTNKYDNTNENVNFPDEGINNVGVIGTHTGWQGAKIPVLPGSTYCFSHNDNVYNTALVGMLMYMDANGDEVSVVDMSTFSNASGLGGKTFITPANCFFIYKNVKVLTRDYIADFQLQMGSITTEYESYEERISSIGGREINSANTVELSVDVDALDTRVTASEADIVSLKESLEVTENADFVEYKNNTTDAGAGSVLINNKTYGKDVKVSKIVLNTTSTTNAQSNSFYLYTVDSGDVVVQDLGEITIDATPSTELEIITSFTLRAGNKIAIAFNLGLGVKYRGATETGFKYNNSPSKRDYDIGETITTLQNFTSDASGFGWEGLELTGETKIVPNFSDIILFGMNNLYQKSIGINGDSMAYGHSIPDLVWGKLIADKNDMNYTNYGINGSWLTNGSVTVGENTVNAVAPLIDRYEGMLDTHDFVPIWIGTNDAANGVPLGLNTSTNTTEFYGALNVICDGLITKYPDKKILFITPMNRASKENLSYVNAMIEICEKFNIPYLDMYRKSGVCFDNTTQYETLTLEDTYHLNATGQQYILPKLENALNSL